MKSFFTQWRRATAFFVCLTALAGFNAAAQAQQAATGSIEGTVIDASNQAIKGAAVAVTNGLEVKRTAVADAAGKFSITGLKPGTYAVQTSAAGFATQTHRGVVVIAGLQTPVSFTLALASVSEEVTVEAEADTSIASQMSPVKSLLDAASARTEITSTYVKEFTPAVTDFSDITQAAPGTVSWSTNGIGDGQAKTEFRGFADGQYTMTWDGVPFNDSNDPSHHSWAYVPSQAIGYVDFDRSPGTASDVGPANFGGSIHMFSPRLGDDMLIKGQESYGSFNTNQFVGEFNAGLFGGSKANFWLEGHHMTSDGYQTGNFQVRTAGTAKFTYKYSDKTDLAVISTVVLVDSNTPDSDATRAQIAAHGDNFLLEKNQYNTDGSLNALWYRYYFYHIPTNFEVVTLNTDFAHGWHLEEKPYTYAYSNHQHFQSDQSSETAALGATSGVNKMNQYVRVGNIISASQASRYGVLRIGSWNELTSTNRYQVKSNPLTWVDSPKTKDLKFHEHFITNTFQPFIEYQLVAIPRWTITAGIKSAFYNMNLKQYADGKVVGSLGGAPFTKHSANYNSWLPSFEANYRISSIWSAYGQYGRGSVIPPSKVFDTSNAEVAVTPKPVVADTYQGGTVVKLNRVSFDADVFRIHYQNSYSSYTPVSGTDKGITFYYANPPSNTTGFEAEGNLYLVHGLSLFLNGTIGQAKYEAGAAKAATSTSPAVGATPVAWVANTPHDTETEGLTYHDTRLDLGIFNKRVGSRWDDNGSVHQAVPYNPFTVTNMFFNYTVRNGSFFDQSKIKLSLNNVFDNHDIVSISPNNGPTATVPYAPDPLDQLQLISGRSIMVTFQIGLAPRRR